MYDGPDYMVAKKTQNNPVQKISLHTYNGVQSQFVGELKHAVIHDVHAILLLPIF
jgi:hypothetical protein